MIFSHICEKKGGETLSFKSAREKSGLTQRDLATELGIDQSTVSLWEVGKTQPRAKLLPRLASILGCTVDELLASDANQA